VIILLEEEDHGKDYRENQNRRLCYGKEGEMWLRGSLFLCVSSSYSSSSLSVSSFLVFAFRGILHL